MAHILNDRESFTEDDLRVAASRCGEYAAGYLLAILNEARKAREDEMRPIFVPARDGVTPTEMADAQHLLNYTARHVVKGKFVILPPGAKVMKTGIPEGGNGEPSVS